MYYNNCKPATRNDYRRYPASVNNWFDGFLKTEGYFVPSVNIVENKENFELEFSVPGYNKEDFSIHVKDDLLTVSAKHEVENKEGDKNFTRREFAKRSFSRSFTLSDKVNQESIDAKYENGILRLIIGKNEKTKDESAKEIKVA